MHADMLWLPKRQEAVAMAQSSGFDERWEDIRRIWSEKENQWLYILIGVAVGLFLSPFLTIRGDIASTLLPEAVGILFTVVVIERFNERRARRQLKEQLIRQMRSTDNGIALQALEELKARKWGFGRDVSLQGAMLSRANLEGAELHLGNEELYSDTGKHEAIINLERADLSLANLEFADLRRANLQQADLGSAYLEDAQILHTNLCGAQMQRAHLQRATVIFSNLRSADLSRADMENCTLHNTDLRGAKLDQVDLRGVSWDPVLPDREELPPILDETTILPDGTFYIPDEGINQLKRFTDPKHPNFWKPEWIDVWKRQL